MFFLPMFFLPMFFLPMFFLPKHTCDNFVWLFRFGPDQSRGVVCRRRRPRAWRISDEIRYAGRTGPYEGGVSAVRRRGLRR